MMMEKAIQCHFSLFIIRSSLVTLSIISFSLITVAKQPSKPDRQAGLDSLWNIWQDKSQPDTTRLKAIHRISYIGYIFSKPDSAFYFAQLEYDFAKSKGLKKQMAGALNTQGVSFALRGNYSKAQEYYLRCLKIQEGIGDKKGIAGSLINMGNNYSNKGDYSKALENFQRGIGICEEIGEKKFMANALISVGNIYNDQGNYSKALKYFQKSLVIYKELGDKRGIAAPMSNMGNIYAGQGNFPKALEYSQKTLVIYEELGDKWGIARSLNNIGKIYLDQGNYVKALEYLLKSLTVYEEQGDKLGIANSMNSIGVIYKKQANYPMAIKYCKDALDIDKENGIIAEQKEACDCLYETYKASNNWQKALEYLELQSELEDSLKADETDKQLQKFEFERKILRDSLDREKEKREIEIAYQKEIRKKDETRNIAIGSGVFVLLLAIGLWSRLRYTNKTKKVIEAERDRSENLLLNILPSEIAEELKEKGAADARDFEEVTILFTDFKEFTETSEKMGPAELVSEINECFKAFDGICEKYNVEKIKTIGDAYMAAGGLPVPDEQAVTNTVKAGLEMAAFMIERKKLREAEGKIPFEMRTGIHTGPVVAGIVGVKKFQYDVWGDTVNTASRMESAGEVSKVNISQDTYALIKDDPQFRFEARGKVAAKGKGEIEMYFVSVKSDE